MDSQATAGRNVHYVEATGRTRAAIVNLDTEGDGVAELTVMFKTGPRVFPQVPYSEEYEVGCWSWMPYQKAKADLPDGNQSESAEPRPPGQLPQWLERQLERLTKGLNGRFEDLEVRLERAERAVGDLQTSTMSENKAAEPEKETEPDGHIKAPGSGPESAPGSASLPSRATAPPLGGEPTPEGGGPAAA